MRGHVQGLEQYQERAQIDILISVFSYAAICLIRNCRLVAKRIESVVIGPKLTWISKDCVGKFLSDNGFNPDNIEIRPSKGSLR